MYWTSFSFLRMFLFIIIPLSSAYSEEEWNIDKFQTSAYARVSGEVTHGDSLNFFIQSRDNCEKVWNTFTVYTHEKPGDIKQLLNKHIPIKINEEEYTAKVNNVSPFLMGYKVMFIIGTFPLKEYIYHLNNLYLKEKRFEIEIVNGVDFKANKYFDVPHNNWKLEKLVPSILEANKICKNINNLES